MRVRQRSRSSTPTERARPEGHAVAISRRSKDDPFLSVKGDFSRQIDDPFKDAYATAPVGGSWIHPIEPPYNPAALLRLPNENDMLRQCIDAMVTNTEGHGWRLEYVGQDGDRDTPKSQAEKQMLEQFALAPNLEYPLLELRKRVRRDLETLGNGYIEIVRNKQKKVVEAWHVPGQTIRLTKKEDQPVNAEYTVVSQGKSVTVRGQRKFRRFLQIAGTERTFFKEFGDPRPIDPKTGLVNDALSHSQTATELVHVFFYTTGSLYGTPRWINKLPAIMGSRQAELTNLDFFRDNAIPAMVVLVSGGAITRTSLNQFEDYFSALKGREAYNRILLLEAKGDEDAADEEGAIPVPKLDIKPLQSEQIKDGLFQDYDKNCGKKVRGAFRLPPLILGSSEDYSHASVKASWMTAESQVFGPDRSESDDNWNLRILADRQLSYWRIRANPPRIVDPDDVIDAIDTFEDVGALTPNIAIGLANEYFDLKIPEFKDEWGDWPFKIVLALAQSNRLKGVEGIADPLSALNQPGFNMDDNDDDPNITKQTRNIERGINREPLKRTKVARTVRKALLQLSELVEQAKAAPAQVQDAA